MQDPNRVVPYTETVEPIFWKPRKEIHEPKCKKSITDIAEPKRGMPYTEKDDPIRKKDLNEIEEPK
jgi:hypothetical protein